MVADEGGATLPFSFVTFLIGVDILLNQSKETKMLISKSKNKEFVEGVTKGLLELGAKQIGNGLLVDIYKTFELDTIVGKLNINLSIDNRVIFSVFSRFENVDLAKEKFVCNPYSGKYNVHIGLQPEITVEQYVDIALSAFECTQPMKYSTTSPL